MRLKTVDVFGSFFCAVGLYGWVHNCLRVEFNFSDLLFLWTIPASTYGVRSWKNSDHGKEPE